MANLNDIATIVDALEKCPVNALQDRCVVVRNRNATCRKCIEACSFDAIEVGGNELSVDAHACVGCGACVVACPTEALVSLASDDESLVDAAMGAGPIAEGAACIACARASATHTADPQMYAVVPCLAQVGESLVLRLAAHGATDVVLVDGDCRTCKYRSTRECVERSIEQSNALLAITGSPARIRRMTGFPEELRTDSAGKSYGSTRRGFFSDAVGAAKETAMTAAKASLEERMGAAAKPQSIGDRLRVSADGTMPRLSMPRHEQAVNALYDLGVHASGEVDSRLFGSVEVDVEGCNACGMCVTFCPTGALARPAGQTMKDPLNSIEFSASDCVQCRLCQDVCWRGCLVAERSVRASQLFDFEPRIFDLSPVKPSKTTLFGNMGTN